MDYNELHKKYRALLVENENLRERLSRYETPPGGKELWEEANEPPPEIPEQQEFSFAPTFAPGIDKNSDPAEKVKLYNSLFRGREDVYAKRWENKRKGTAGYAPACGNEWKPGICRKPEIKCSACTHKDFLPLSESVLEDHLRGSDNLVAGIYPMCADETCWFLAIDFDNEGWQKDIKILREVCREFKVPVAVERSRSGAGAHAWFFFERPVAASLARKFGTAMLTCAMNRRHDISFGSYDRLFPNQDTMPKGGFGNLIALPLQKTARNNGNSVFIDEHIRPYDDQWACLASIRRLSEKELERLIPEFCRGSELGLLRKDVEEDVKPWEESRETRLNKEDFQEKIEVVKANMLFIPKTGISQRALNRLKRLAAFKNPEFYRAQAMRLPTFNKPRIISCADETAGYLCLPRGCEADLNAVIKELDIEITHTDKTNHGRRIDVSFNGSLREEQSLAVKKLLEHDTGVLCGTTAFGKTIAAIKLISERKLNTLILVGKVNLVSQWEEKLYKFLEINETIPDTDTSKIIGQIGGGKNTLNGIIDIAVMQSLNRGGQVKDCVKDYGMVIVDECHHVPAFSFETILREVRARYVYGLTATPARKDGHHPIICMQCGPVRYRDDAIRQAEKRPFEHYVVPRFTAFMPPVDREEQDLMIHDLYAAIVPDKMRNRLITDDVVKCYKQGRNSLILTERTAHVELLAKELGEKIPDVISVTGGMGTKKARDSISRIRNQPADKPLTLVATGRYIGEGFDEPRLDTLFLAMPIAWKGTLQQYAGRLHRLSDGKKDVQIYDYVDIHVRMFERMYHKRLNGYASIGYRVKGETAGDGNNIDIIFNTGNFLPVFANDLTNASGDILIASPYVTKVRILKMLQVLQTPIANGVKVTVVTRPSGEFKNKNARQAAIQLIVEAGAAVVYRSNIHQKFAVVDQQLVWYGSINLLSFGNAEESIMRIESVDIANELVKSIGNDTGKEADAVIRG